MTTKESKDMKNTRKMTASSGNIFKDIGFDDEIQLNRWTRYWGQANVYNFDELVMHRPI